MIKKRGVQVNQTRFIGPMLGRHYLQLKKSRDHPTPSGATATVSMEETLPRPREQSSSG